MIAYIKDNVDWTTKDILEFENYSFNTDIEFAEKSTITVLQKPNIKDDDFVICKDGNEVIFIGICEDYTTDNASGYTITLAQKECLFDRQILVGTDSVISSTGIEDFIKAEIEANWTNSGDTLLDKDYITIMASTHTPISTSVNSDNGVYNLKTFLGNAKEYYGIKTEFTYTDSALTITISKDNSASLPIDVTIAEVSEYQETYNVNVLAKLIAKWDGYTRLDYIQSSGTQYIDTGLKHNSTTDDYEITFKSVATPNAELIGGGLYTSADGEMYIGDGSSNGKCYWNYFKNSITTVYELPNQTSLMQGFHTLKKVGNNCYFDGTLVMTITNQISTAFNLFLFALNRNGSVLGQGKYAISHYAYKRNGNLVRNLIPAKRNSDGAIGLLDIVNNVFYGNNGTGVFTYGTALTWDYFLRNDRTITTDKADVNRANGVVKSVAMTQATYAEMYQAVLDEFKANSYEHKITFKLHKDSKAYPVSSYYVGRNATIKTKTGIQTSLITGMNKSSDSSFIGFTFGKLKVTLIDKLRQLAK